MCVCLYLFLNYQERRERNNFCDDKITLVYTKIQFSEGDIFPQMKNRQHNNNNDR